MLYDPRDASAEVKAAAGFLAGYSGRTREAYTLDLRQFCGWCANHDLGLFEVKRKHFEFYAREFEELGPRGDCCPHKSPMAISGITSTASAPPAVRPLSV